MLGLQRYAGQFSVAFTRSYYELQKWTSGSRFASRSTHAEVARKNRVNLLVRR